MHPDQATDSIVNFALEQRKPFAIVPCCVFARQFPRTFLDELGCSQPVFTRTQLVAHILQRAAPQGASQGEAAAQLRLKPVADLRLQRQQQTLQQHPLLSADNQAVELLFVHTCHIVMVLTGFGVHGRCQEGFKTMFPGFSNEGTFLESVLTWTSTAGSAASLEALLRDPLLRGSHIDQHSAACIALMVVNADYDGSYSAFPARISLAATLRKLMHPASAPMWQTIGPSPRPVSHWGCTNLEGGQRVCSTNASMRRLPARTVLL
ncbi:MAG: hypothetical protein WDW36_004033 [Sanguina aurantia]